MRTLYSQRRIKQNIPSVAVILVADTEDEELLFPAMMSGASACVTKNIDPDDLLVIIRDVAQGGHPISEVMFRPNRITATCPVLTIKPSEPYSAGFSTVV